MDWSSFAIGFAFGALLLAIAATALASWLLDQSLAVLKDSNEILDQNNKVLKALLNQSTNKGNSDV